MLAHTANKDAAVELYMIDAITQALDDALSEDPRVVLLGEDIGCNGGVFRATAGLQEKYGEGRVMDTPLAEALISGLCVGLASQGMRPVAEIQFMGFVYAALEHLISHASRLRNRTRGRLHCPMVMRIPFGGGIHAPEHHSESIEAMLAHIPGLRVVVPSSPARAYGLLLSAIRDPDPVIFLEPKRTYRASQQLVYYVDKEGLPLDSCFQLREGSDISLVSWGAMLQECLFAAEQLSERGISVEVMDVATLKPLDIDSLCDSVEKTGRCLIVQEAARSGGLAGEISASISERIFKHLQQPVQRLCGYDTVMPYLKLEQYYMPSTQQIVAKVQAMLECP